MNLIYSRTPFPALKSILFGLCLAILGTTITGCGGTETKDGEAKLPHIVTTTGMIRDIAEQVGGKWITVEALMGPGVDPHLYKATQGDLSRLRAADLILYNGLHLEGKMGDILEKLGRKKPVVAVAESVPQSKLLKSADFADAIDPHIWMDVSIWSMAATQVEKALSDLLPDHQTDFKANLDQYLNTLSDLHNWVQEQVASIPENQRVMITAHDAFQYFGRAYQIDVRGLQGISTVSEYGLQDVSNLVNFITDNKIKAVFVESSVPPKSLEAVLEGCKQRGHEVKIGGTLFSDAMGEAGTPEDTYEGMIRWNVNTLVKSLK